MIVIVPFPGHGLYQRWRDIDLALSFYISIHLSISHSAPYLIADVLVWNHRFHRGILKTFEGN